MKEITRERCRALKAFLLKAFLMSAPPKPGGCKAGSASINARMAMLTQFLKFAVAQDWLERNPMEGLALNPRLVSSSRVQKSGFTDEQLRIVTTLEQSGSKSPAKPITGNTTGRLGHSWSPVRVWQKFLS